MPNKYKVILADPPWSYSNSGTRGAAQNQYPTMKDQDIYDMDIPAANDSVLLLWVTWPKLVEGMKVVKSWGFEYVTGFPWVKITGLSEDLFDGDPTITVPYGVGFWMRGTTEPLLIGRRGNVSPPTESMIGLLSPNLKHSRKPDSIYDYAETLEGPYLELFARRRREGWDSWGNEVGVHYDA